MTDRIKNAMDKGEGKADELAGRGKQAQGNLTGDERTRSEGEAQEMAGKSKGFIADIKNKIQDVKNKLSR